MAKEYLPKSYPLSQSARVIAESCDYLLQHSDGRKTPLWYALEIEKIRKTHPQPTLRGLK